MKRNALSLSCLAALACVSGPVHAQEDGKPIPKVVVTGEAATDALTVPDTVRAMAAIRRTPGAVEVVPDTAFKDGPVQTVKDILDWVPGVFAQPRYGDDARVSIRGSGLSRNYGNRGLQMYMDGVPIHTSDGLVDLFEIDPSAYRYVEVFKGANAFRFGANSLGGAINYVTPTGRDAAKFDGRVDAGSFGYRKGQASTGGYDGPFDWFVTASAQRVDGFRDHSNGHEERASANFGYRISPDAETRFYLNLNSIRQRLPGEVTKQSALETPEAADGFFELVDQQRNIDSQRVANKTTLRFGPTTVDLGLFALHRHVMHPIYQWLDYHVHDHGGFVRATDERTVDGYHNRLTVGADVHDGDIDTNQYDNLPGAVKGALAASMLDKSDNASAYVENTFYVRPDVSLVAGVRYLHAVRERRDRFLANGNQSGRRSYGIYSPKIGLLWDVDESWQIFANISRSAEVPTYDVNTFSTPASSTIDAQRATTFEAGTRGNRADLTWDVAVYRANIRNELQCLSNPTTPGVCSVANADRTVHQGLEAGVGARLFKSVADNEDGVWLHATYTYNDFRFDGDRRYGDNRLPGAPPHYVRAELMYKHPGGLFIGPNVEWTPRRYYADNTNRATVDSYALLNVRIGFEPRRGGWSAYLEGRNLTDKRYIASTAVAETADATSALSEPGSGRAIYAGVRYKW